MRAKATADAVPVVGPPPTSYDVARLAGVSQSAVSRCFSPGASISKRTRLKVEAAARQLGYAPDPLARSLITRRSGLVGLIVTAATLRYTPQLVHDLSEALRTAGFLPLLTTLTDERELASVWPALLGYRPEAIVSLATADGPLARAGMARGIPLLFVNRKPPRGVEAVSIRCDHAAATAALVRELLAVGHERFAFVAGPADAPVSRERLAGFERGLGRGAAGRAMIIHADYSYAGGAAAAARLLSSRSRPPDAIVCANDEMALGVLDYIRAEARLRVPDDVAVTGFDDLPEAARPRTLLTTVEQPTATMARLAVEALQVLRDNPAATPGEHLIAGRLHWRASTRPLASPAREADV